MNVLESNDYNLKSTDQVHEIDMMISEEKRQKFAYDREIQTITTELAKKKKPGAQAKSKQEDKKKSRGSHSISVSQAKISIPEDCGSEMEEVRSTRNKKNKKQSFDDQDQQAMYATSPAGGGSQQVGGARS